MMLTAAMVVAVVLFCDAAASQWPSPGPRLRNSPSNGRARRDPGATGPEFATDAFVSIDADLFTFGPKRGEAAFSSRVPAWEAARSDVKSDELSAEPGSSGPATIVGWSLQTASISETDSLSPARPRRIPHALCDCGARWKACSSELPRASSVMQNSAMTTASARDRSA